MNNAAMSINTDMLPSRSSPLTAAAGPVLCIAVSYVGPGKWVASVEGGARLGYDMALFIFVVSFISILCQYLSACLAIATNKDLAQICREEYDNVTCLFLGIQAEVSMILLDLAMVLGTAYGLNAVSGIDLLYCIILTGFDTAIFPFLSDIIGNPKFEFVPICSASFALLSYFFGVLVTQPERALSMGCMLDKLSGENAYVLMALLGANIMPHNFYLHSSFVQLDQGQSYVSKAALCHYHFFATLCIFSVIYLADCVLMTLSANMFYDSGLVSLGLLDALSLLEQVFRSPYASFSLVVFVFFSNHLIPLTWSMGRQAITEYLFRLDVPRWFHRATIRAVAIIPAFYCVWNAGAEGVSQLLIFTQVLGAIMLPSSVIPLFRVASCKSIMGECKVSPVVEVLAFITFMGMLGLNIAFVMEMTFGTSEWVGGLSWNLGSFFPIPYYILLMSAFASVVFLLVLVSTPLRSASADAQVRRWDEKEAASELSSDGDKVEVHEAPFHIEKSVERQENASQLENSVSELWDMPVPGPVLNLPETLLDFDEDHPSNIIPDGKCEDTFSVTEQVDLDESGVSSETPIKIDLQDDAGSANTETEKMDELDVQNDKVDGPNPWEPEDLGKLIPEVNQSATSDGPGSFKSSAGTVDEVASSTGSLSRLAGLGRSVRRQLTAILDEFWGQLFGYHGEATDEAKAKKLVHLIGVDSGITSKSSFSSVKMDKQLPGSVNANDANASGPFQSSRSVGYLNQQLSQGAVHQRPSVISKPVKYLDSYEQNSSFGMVDIGERRYFSLRAPSSSDGYDQQPATVHGSDMSSYLGQIAKDRGYGSARSQQDSVLAPSVTVNSVSSYGRQSSQKPLGGLRNLTPPGFDNVPMARNNALKSERFSNDLYASEAVDFTTDSSSSDVKKYYSLPDISGLRHPQKDLLMLGNSVIHEQSVSRPAHEHIASSWARTAYGFHDLFAPNVSTDAFSTQFHSSSVSGSLWPKPPFEQFGVANNSPLKAPGVNIDVEAELLQSFRSCIIKLLKLEGSDWLFSQNDGVDEDVICRVASREKFLYEVETRSFDRKIIKTDLSNSWMSVPNCGEGCVWCADLVVSFGVWCIHRILNLSLIESRPELWGKYTYVLNRLQGIIDPAFSKPRSPRTSCFCLQLPPGYEQMCSSPPQAAVSEGSLPPTPKLGPGKFTTAAMLLDMIKDVEMAVSSRKGRSGTAAGDVAFPKGKENLASVLKRYKRRLSNNKTGGSPETGRKPGVAAAAPVL